MKKSTGIWLDFREAHLINLTEQQEDFIKIWSDIEDFHPKGGARSKTPWGPMDKISESTYLERRKHQEHAYYQKIIEAINEVDEVYIFGPAEAKDGLAKELKNRSNNKPILLAVESSDKMTHNQKMAKVKKFFAGR